MRWSTTQVEDHIRRLLGLNPLPPGWMAPGVRISPSDERGLRSMDFLDEQGKAEDERRVADEGWRGRLADDLAHLPGRSKYRAQMIYWQGRGMVERRLALRQISASRWLYFDSPYVYERGNTQEVEGFLRAPGGKSIAFSIHCTEGLSLQAKQAWASGEPMNLRGLSGEYLLLVPGKQLDDQSVRTALQHWYMDRYGWDATHWSCREGILPNICTQLTWQDWREYWQESLGEDLATDEQAHAKWLAAGRAKAARYAKQQGAKLYAKFGLR